ncbi:hypothetical protein MUP77_24365, partial [Candidatus Bathyarchaeota archaeon]|nr:hypothetical protein [Candidatus Bathyarchaeota archaeon]
PAPEKRAKYNLYARSYDAVSVREIEIPRLIAPVPAHIKAISATATILYFLFNFIILLSPPYLLLSLVLNVNRSITK